MTSPVTDQQALQVVGIVASAGGLEAMLELLPRLKPTGHTAWVVAQHMGSQAQGDLMARLLGRTSNLPVVVAQPDQLLKSDTVYLIPAGYDGRVEQGLLHLSAPAATSISSPSGNELFYSLAASQMPQATAVILSGAGRDGVEGARAVKRAGGRVYAQEPSTIKFNGMPSSAIEADVVDCVLPAAALADALNGVLEQTAPVNHARTAAMMPDARSADWAQLLAMVRQTNGVDFSGYKAETLVRRLHRRIASLQLYNLPAYLAYCKRHPHELQTLQQHFLVSFSSFFRDRPSFEVVAKALRDLVSAKPAEAPIRIWVPACASGEEAYTLAMVLAEVLGGPASLQRVSILGTDLNPGALEVARAGRYRSTALREVAPHLLERYFTTAQGHHREVVPALRQCCQFEQANVFDPVPKEQYDMVSCRNLLIYLNADWQSRLLEHLHTALAPNGLLFVAPVESVGVEGSRLFTPIDRDHRLYRRRTPGRSAPHLE